MPRARRGPRVTDVLFLLVIYGNHEEVAEFISGREADTTTRYAYAVCDNSRGSENWRPPPDADALVVERPDNPGYLEGALFALDCYIESRGLLPNWVFLANTDLTFSSTHLSAILNGGYDASQAVVIAPRISDGKGLERNPHLLAPRPLWRLAVNSVLTRFVVVAYCYLVASSVLSWLLRRGGVSDSDSPSTVYAPYGAIVGFSRRFLEDVVVPRNVPLLAEEFVLAEVARRAGVPVAFEPRIRVHHSGRSTTGPSVSWDRARLLSAAFQYIYTFATGSAGAGARL